MCWNVFFGFFLAILPVTFGFCQHWLHFPTTNNNRLDIGNLEVTGDSLTIEALVTVQNFSPPTDAGDIVSKHTNALNCSYLFRPTQFAIRTSMGFVELANPLPLCYDSTYHLAGTYDGDSLKYYVNGYKLSSKHHTGVIAPNALVTGIGNVTGVLNFNEQFIGYLDEVRIWKVARTPAQINAYLYILPEPATQSGLLAYYNFDGNYLNQQGNPQYDAVPAGDNVFNVSNPYYQNTLARFGCAVSAIHKLESGGENPKIDFQNHPNPFNRETSIPISIPEGTQSASLEIYGMDGRKVYQIKLSETREQHVTIKSSMLPASGIYLYTLVIDGQKQPMQRMLLAK
jgi:hypothetical protein